jgi:hypothetical protein
MCTLALVTKHVAVLQSMADPTDHVHRFGMAIRDIVKAVKSENECTVRCRFVNANNTACPVWLAWSNTGKGGRNVSIQAGTLHETTHTSIDMEGSAEVVNKTFAAAADLIIKRNEGNGFPVVAILFHQGADMPIISLTKDDIQTLFPVADKGQVRIARAVEDTLSLTETMCVPPLEFEGGKTGAMVIGQLVVERVLHHAAGVLTLRENETDSFKAELFWRAASVSAMAGATGASTAPHCFIRIATKNYGKMTAEDQAQLNQVIAFYTAHFSRTDTAPVEGTTVLSFEHLRRRVHVIRGDVLRLWTALCKFAATAQFNQLPGAVVMSCSLGVPLKFDADFQQNVLFVPPMLDIAKRMHIVPPPVYFYESTA